MNWKQSLSTLMFTALCALPLSAVTAEKTDAFNKSACSGSSCPKYAKYDYIIVGNGSAGSILARKLTDDLKTTVLVLEDGINHADDPVVLDPNPFSSFIETLTLYINPLYARTYPTGITGAFQTYSEGRGWGGSSAHNFMLAVRGTPGIYDGWAAASGNPIWGYDALLPYMKALETYTSNGGPVNTNQRGTDGPIKISQFPPVNPAAGAPNPSLSTVIANTDGIGYMDDYNDYTTGILGVTPNQLFVTPPALSEESHRSYSALEFLTPNVVTPEGRGVNGRKLRIESNTWASRVLFKGNKAIGIEFISNNGRSKVLKAYGKQIILCAGAIQTPALLQRSGVGDAELLNSLNIPVVVNNPNVGANLINQYGAGVITFVPPAYQPPVIASSSFINGFPYVGTANEQVRRLELLTENFGPGAGGSVVIEFLPFILEPKSRGNIQIVSTDPLIPPLVNLNMYSDGPATPGQPIADPTDLDLTVAGYRIVNDIIQAIPGAGIINIPADYFNDPTNQLLASLASQGSIPEDHITGTTRMSTSIADGVVDGNLRVWGTQNLMIVDLGAVPVIPDGNTCYCVYVLALRAAALLGVPTPPAL